jgi:hypothetical protein
VGIKAMYECAGYNGRILLPTSSEVKKEIAKEQYPPTRLGHRPMIFMLTTK